MTKEPKQRQPKPSYMKFPVRRIAYACRLKSLSVRSGARTMNVPVTYLTNDRIQSFDPPRSIAPPSRKNVILLPRLTAEARAGLIRHGLEPAAVVQHRDGVHFDCWIRLRRQDAFATELEAAASRHAHDRIPLGLGDLMSDKSELVAPAGWGVQRAQLHLSSDISKVVDTRILVRQEAEALGLLPLRTGAALIHLPTSRPLPYRFPSLEAAGLALKDVERLGDWLGVTRQHWRWLDDAWRISEREEVSPDNGVLVLAARLAAARVKLPDAPFLHWQASGVIPKIDGAKLVLDEDVVASRGADLIEEARVWFARREQAMQVAAAAGINPLELLERFVEARGNDVEALTVYRYLAAVAAAAGVVAPIAVDRYVANYILRAGGDVQRAVHVLRVATKHTPRPDVLRGRRHAWRVVSSVMDDPAILATLHLAEHRAASGRRMFEVRAMDEINAEFELVEFESTGEGDA